MRQYTELINSNNIERYLALGSPWEFDTVLDYHDSFLPGCFGYGVSDEQGRKWGYILVQLQRDSAVIRAMRVLYEVRPDDARLLLNSCMSHLRFLNIYHISYNYLETKDNTSQSKLLMRYGFRISDNAATIFHIDGSDYKSERQLSKRYDQIIIPFDKASIFQKKEFEARFGNDIPEFLDYRLTEDMEPTLSFCAVVGNRIVGFIVCTMGEASLEVRQAYIDDDNSALFGAMVLKVSNVYDSIGKKKNIYICAVNDMSDKMVRKIFDGLILSEDKLIHAVI